MNRMSKRVSALTGLDPAVVQRSGGRITASTFEREILRDRGLVASTYDATVTGYDPNPYAPTSRYSDPQLHALSAPLIGAMTDLYRSKLNWQVDGQYQLLNGEVNSRWEWGRGRSLPQNVDDLRAALALDKRVRVLAAHGATDMVTPYFETQLILDQLPAYGSPDRIELKVYGGGHMFYSRDTSRRALRNDAEALFRATEDVEPAARD
jgi:carboxypeptidase C (cathepsin A)